jgi:hypothetical protein
MKKAEFEGWAEQPWIGVDLDGTLAHYDSWVSPTSIGKPIPLMVDRVKRWLSEGKYVKIFTARVSHPDKMLVATITAAIRMWCIENIGAALPVTCVKDTAMLELWDDRAVQVTINTGEPVGKSTRGLD